MARKEPTPATVKKLFALSGNGCSFNDCNNKIIDDGIVIGEICHIESAEEGGKRYNERSNDEQRRSFANLTLMCPSCHKKIDSDEINYNVDLLKSWKISHEEKYINKNFQVSDSIVKQSIQRFMEQINKNTGIGGQINNQATKQKIETQIGTQNNFYNQNQSKHSDEKYRYVYAHLKTKINSLKDEAAPPKRDVIDFRKNFIKNQESDIYELPVSELLFRKENGRIKAEVASYEKSIGEIDELINEGQNILRGFLNKSDPEKKEVLKQQIKKKGQRQPAIITCDGFLINGNRRKMVFEELYEESRQNPEFVNMRVIILPDNVTEFEIKRLENSYQLQDEGKSEYHGLNRALTLRNNEKDNYSIEAQILDDPQHADKSGSELNKAIKELRAKFLNPLECVDRYLETFNREGIYTSISEGAGDKEGRWQAFIDYSSFYYSSLDNPLKRNELGIKESEVRTIENAIFKIIRKRSLDSDEIEKALGKVHSFVRGGNLKKYLDSSKTDAKKYFIKIAKEVDEDIPEDQKTNDLGEKYSERIIDEKWGINNRKAILGNLMQAYKTVFSKSERDKPLDLLGDALKKLNHENLKIENMGTEHYNKALILTKKISQKADEIYDEIDHARGNLNKLKKRK